MQKEYVRTLITEAIHCTDAVQSNSHFQYRIHKKFPQVTKMNAIFHNKLNPATNNNKVLYSKFLTAYI